MFAKVFIAVIVIQSSLILIGGQLNIIRVDQFIKEREYGYAQAEILDVQDAYNHKLKQIRSNVFSLFFESNQSESILEKIKNYKGTTQVDDLRHKAEIEQFLQSMAYTDESIDSILFIRNKDEERFAFVRYFDPSLLPEFDSMISLDTNEYVKVYPAGNSNKNMNSNKNDLVFALKVKDPNALVESQSVGYLIISVDTDFLQKAGSHLRTDSLIELKNANGTIRMSGSTIPTDAYRANIDDDKLDSTNYFVTKVQNSADDMVFKMFISKKKLSENILAMKKNQWITLSAIMFLNVFVAFYISRGLSKRVQTLSRNMRKYTPGEFVYPIPIHKNDEFTILEDTYNQLISKLSEFIQQEYVLEIKSKEAELQLLHSQVNPHFLSNMLEILRMQAIKENNVNLSETIYQLSEIFRWNIRNKETVVTLYEELYYVEYYLKLQQFRYPKARFNIEFPDHYQNERMAKFSIQPIVENIFKHAMNKGKNIDIRIIVTEVQDKLQVKVTDNGKGIMPEDLKRLRANLQMTLFESKESTSVGIMNVHSRLRLIFGINYGLDIESKIGEGTEVTLYIPKLEVTHEFNYEKSHYC
ncbi:histidine kinase [Paenibacillus sp. KQZ6P-2]|uniref:Histidine kinase n=1 Tax=Paenibacillus mangrovi TaxID=2931978 RepID=A0A9X1WTJ2_9BACL|nr:histidine kinase [Paenibacillus mangrovi]MCJ8011524.1 histidine kinase [Paenibacillus mangrovi]